MTKPWREAIFKLRHQLADECLSQKAELRRFQKRRLIENFIVVIGSPAEAPRNSVMSYWLFCGSPWQDQLGYDEARQQHYAEMKTLGFSPHFQANTRDFADELIFRLDSLASWIEAHESWIAWRGLNALPAAWDGDDPIARQQARDAGLLATLRTITEGISDWAVARIVESFATWSDSQWAKILKTAARIVGQGEEPTELETWVWWRYPIFSRYHWSAGEVCRAARENFGEIPDVINEAAFQSAWVRRGLRFTGKRTRRERPPLWDFVVNERVPRNISSTYSMLTWTPYEKSRSKS
jgi:predicted transcriptional regulator